MHVIIPVYTFETGLDPAAWVARQTTLRGWAEALVELGARVTVLQRFHRAAAFTRAGVTYRFLRDGRAPHLWAGRIPWRMHRATARLARSSTAAGEPTLVHLHGLMYALAAGVLRLLLPPSCALVVQHHAEGPWPGLRGLAQRWGLQALDGFLFTAPELAEPWLAAGILPSAGRVFTVMEGSTFFHPCDRQAARAATGLAGAPLFLWVGRLNANKDPLTVLAGFEPIAARLPAARLALIYSAADLLPAVRDRINASPVLRRAVQLRGRVPHAQMQAIYNSADYFLLGSHHESAGFAVVEALACGVPPIVTDIPSFRLMTDEGRIGALWPPGDAPALTAACERALAKSWPRQSAAARRFFEQRLSFPAIAGDALAIYRRALTRRG